MTPFSKLLVLDLDETLLHTTEQCISRPPDFRIDGYVVYKRPGVQEFLDWCFTSFQDVGLWTAGTLSYGHEVLPHLCNPKRFSFIWGRERCGTQVDFESREQHWVKDIKKLCRLGYCKEQILCVDDTPRNFARSYGNYIRVSPFMGDLDDRELFRLTRYLLDIGQTPDVRSVDKRTWQSKYSEVI